jgi:hypothetical protein
MIIIKDIEKIENPILHDAVLILEYAGNTFNRLYIDPNGECTITFKGKLSEDDIKLFFCNMNSEVSEYTSIDDEEIEYYTDYCYLRNRTEIYTKDGFKY